LRSEKREGGRRREVRVLVLLLLSFNRKIQNYPFLGAYAPTFLLLLGKSLFANLFEERFEEVL
jgi:hypothetical protein